MSNYLRMAGKAVIYLRDIYVSGEKQFAKMLRTDDRVCPLHVKVSARQHLKRLLPLTFCPLSANSCDCKSGSRKTLEVLLG